MTVRRWTLARVVLGACAGAVVGVVVMFVIADSVAAIGDGKIALYGLLLVIPGVPTAGAAGALLGGWGAAADPSSPAFRLVGGTAAALVTVAVTLGVALPDNRPKPDVEVKGCMVSPRDGILHGGDPRYVVVYDRVCPGWDSPTVNVSVLASIYDRIEGPGNALVIAGDSTLAATSITHEIDVFAGFRDSLHLEIVYDYRARVVSHASSVAGLEIVLRPEYGLPRPANQPPSWVARKRIEASMPAPIPVRPARDSVLPYRPAAPGPLDHTDANGCTIRPRRTVDGYGRHVAVYDRDCATTPHRTINVALLAPDAALEGSGNVMVLSLDRAPEAVLTGAEIPVTVTLPDARHMEVLYDHRFRVIGHGYPGDSLQITVRPRPEATP